MTRINCLPIETLTRAHLFSEIRELPRTRHYRPRHNVPPTYRMGKGHVIFFMNKGGWLVKRHRALLDEWFSSGYVTSIPPLALPWPDEFMGDWEPDEEAMRVSRGRIEERLSKEKDT